MKRCPDCGFRAQDNTCPLCGVRMKDDPAIRTHVHKLPGEQCAVADKETGRKPVQSRPATHVHKAEGERCVLPNQEKPDMKQASPVDGFGNLIKLLGYVVAFIVFMGACSEIF